MSEKPVAAEYSLTERGQSSEPVIDSLKERGKTYLRPARNEDGSVCQDTCSDIAPVMKPYPSEEG